MEPLGERPVWSMSGSEMLSALDAVNAEIARLKTRGLHLVAGLEDNGYAKEIGAHDTARLLAFRYCVDSSEAHRDVRLARALPKYRTVAAALPDTTTAPPAAGPDLSTTHPADAASTADSDADGAAADGPDGVAVDGLAADGVAVDDGAGEATGGAGGRPLHPAQAQAIVWALERVAARVPVEHLAVAEEQLVGLAARLSPGQLRTAGKAIGDLLDSDGPGPGEDKAYGRESLTLAAAENGVKFRGFLANENAELLRALTHAGARPRKTIDGELDPRSREKRQADALTSALTIAAAAADTGYTPPTTRTASPTTSRPAATDPTTPTAAPADPGDSSATTDAATWSVPTDPATRSAPTDPATRSAPTDPATWSAATERGDATATGEAATGTLDGPATDTAGAGGTVGAARAASGWVPGFGAKANITVTIDFNDLKAAAANGTGQLVYGDALSAAAIRRLACDAAIIPLVLGSSSEPLDVGRSERLVNRAMRRALNARDKGCVVCGAPPIHCDAHHVQSWIDGGPTAISNLVLLCRRHHIDLHAGHWTITITNGTVHVSRPTWANPPVARRAAQGHPPARASQTPVAAHRAAGSPFDASPPEGITTWAEPNGAGLCVPDSPADASPPNGALTRAAAAGSGHGALWDESAPSPERAFRPASDGDTRSGGEGTDGVKATENVRPDPWGESEVPEHAGRRNRWANQTKLEEAARFAVWGETTRNGEPVGASTPRSR